MKIVNGGFLMPPRFIHEPGEPAFAAAAELAEAVASRPGWSTPYAGDTTAQRETQPREMGFRTGPWAGVCWDCGDGGRWSAFVRAADLRLSEYDADFGFFPTATGALVAADVALDDLLVRMSR